MYMTTQHTSKELNWENVSSMQEIQFTSLTNCQEERKVLHSGILYQVRKYITKEVGHS